MYLRNGGALGEKTGNRIELQTHTYQPFFDLISGSITDREFVAYRFKIRKKIVSVGLPLS